MCMILQVLNILLYSVYSKYNFTLKSFYQPTTIYNYVLVCFKNTGDSVEFDVFLVLVENMLNQDLPVIIK